MEYVFLMEKKATEKATVKCEVCGAPTDRKPLQDGKIRCEPCVYWSRPWRVLEE